MPRFFVTSTKAGVNAANTSMWQLRASATAELRLVEVGMSIAVAPTTGPSWRLNRPTAIGTSSATGTPQRRNANSSAPTALLDTAWSVNPTLAADDLMRYATPNAIGSGIVWSFYDMPMIVDRSTGVVVNNGNAVGTTLGSFNIYYIFDE